MILRRMRRMSLQMDLYMFTMTDDRQPWIWNNTGQIITYLHSSVLTVAVFSFNSTPYCKIVNIAVEIWQSSALWICHRRRLPDFFRKTSGNVRNSSADRITKFWVASWRDGVKIGGSSSGTRRAPISPNLPMSVFDTFQGNLFVFVLNWQILIICKRLSSVKNSILFLLIKLKCSHLCNLNGFQKPY